MGSFHVALPRQDAVREFRNIQATAHHMRCRLLATATATAIYRYGARLVQLGDLCFKVLTVDIDIHRTGDMSLVELLG